MLAAVAHRATEAHDANPFDELRPVLRSEEDDIRKGIFSTALKRLRTITPEEKVEWCVAIQEATAPKTSGCAAAGTKRPRDTSADAANDGGAPATAGKTPEETQADLVASVRAFSAEQASEYVAAFMRAQLDKVVGGSLNNLAVASLRVLCLMLGIVTRARGKDALYNTLASYYYTHCEKLGKRVSRDTFTQTLAQQDAEMLNRLQPSAKPHKAASSSSPTEVAPAKDGLKRGVEAATSAARRAPISTKGSVAPLPASLGKPLRAADNRSSAKATSHKAHIAASSSGDAGKENVVTIDYGGRLFHQADPSSHASATATASSSSESQEAEEPALCGVALERKVASIIQLYDPVTVDIIVKKLAQIGFRHAMASSIVEDILRTFHQKQLIFFDSGIAYMM